MRVTMGVIGALGIVLGVSPAFAECHYEQIRFYFDGSAATSEGAADTGKACVMHLHGRRITSIEISHQASHGKVAVDGETGSFRVIYVSAGGYRGADSFTMTAHGVMRTRGKDYLAAGVPGDSTQTINMTVQ